MTRIALVLIALCLSLSAAHAQETQPVFAPVSTELATPAAGHQYLIPVVVIRYLPTVDGVTLGNKKAGKITLDSVMRATDLMNRQVKFSLEEGSRYHGYKDPTAKPALGYKIVAIITIYEKLPPFEPEKPGAHQPDYNQILKRINAEDYVMEQGVKEFWLWGYHDNSIYPVESDMASPVTGDVSNSDRRRDDMPIFAKTYALFNYNYLRTVAEAVHDHGHHMEVLMDYINRKQDGNTDLWRKKFMGGDATGKWITGRCGSTHMPPNTVKDYDYQNTTPVESDIADWTPDGSRERKMVSADTWGSIPYAWPDGIMPTQKTEAQYYIYWRQNIPGRDNNIRYGNEYLTNWWRFVGDWDNVNDGKVGLHSPDMDASSQEFIKPVIVAPLVPTAPPPPLSATGAMTLTNGEIWLRGSVTAILAAQSLQMAVAEYTLPSGKVVALPAPKPKQVILTATTKMALMTNDGSEVVALEQLRIGDSVAVVGADSGTGQPITVRSVQIRRQLERAFLRLNNANLVRTEWGKAHDDADIDGKPLQIGSRTFSRGIGTHALATLRFPLDGKYQWLSFWTGVASDMKVGSVVVQTLLDGKKVDETPVLKAKEEPRFVSLPLAGASELTLYVTDATDGIAEDHVNFGDLCLSTEQVQH